MKKGCAVGTLLILLLNHLCQAQDKWDLRKCVEYAVTNNISVKQADVQARLAALTLEQSKLNQLPSLNFSGNSGFNSGRNQDPTNFTLTTVSYFSSQYNLQAGLNFFNFGSLQNFKQGSSFALEAANAATDKLRNDVSPERGQCLSPIPFSRSTIENRAKSVKAVPSPIGAYP